MHIVRNSKRSRLSRAELHSALGYTYGATAKQRKNAMKKERLAVLMGVALLSGVVFICGLTGESLAQIAGTRVPDNPYYITKPYYQIHLSRRDKGSNFDVGVGVDMSNPMKPIMVPTGPFRQIPTANLGDTPLDKALVADSINEAVFTYNDDATESEEADILTGYFKMAHPYVDAQAALKSVRDQREKSRSIYVLITYFGETRAVDKNMLEWKEDICSEKLKNDDERLKQFIMDYGSHYISSITYGFRGYSSTN